MSATLKQIRNAVMCDSIGKNKAGNFVARRGYFYTNGGTAEKFANRVISELKAAGIEALIVDTGDVWKAFRGGASVANQSHWFVEFTA